MDTSYFGLAAADGASVLWRMGDLVGNVVPSLVGKNDITWLKQFGDAAATGLTTATAWNGMPILSLPGGIYGAIDISALPIYDSPGTYELILRIPAGAQPLVAPDGFVVFSYGDRNTRLCRGISLLPDAANAVRTFLYGDDIDMPLAFSRANFHVLTVSIASTGDLRVYLDGVKAPAGKFAGIPNTIPTRSRAKSAIPPVINDFFYNAAGSAAGQMVDWCAAAVWARVCTDAEILARHAAAMMTHKLAGVALLDTGAIASGIVVRRWSDRKTIAQPAIAGGGAWSVSVPPGDYEVVAHGPTGYRPVCDAPVTAVAA